MTLLVNFFIFIVLHTSYCFDLEIQTPYNPMRILEGSDFELKCIYRGHDVRGLLHFFFNNEDVDTLNSNFTISKMLTASKKDMTIQDGGQYRCRHTELNLVFTTTVQVIEVIAENQTFNHSRIILGCYPSFYPPTINDRYIIHWYKNEILLTSPRYNVWNMELVIENPDRQIDIGQYNCTLVFSNGTSQEQSISKTLHVTDDGYTVHEVNNSAFSQLKALSFLWTNIEVIIVSVIIQYTFDDV